MGYLFGKRSRHTKGSGVEDSSGQEPNYGFMCSNFASYVKFRCCEACHAEGRGWYMNVEGVEVYVCCRALDAVLAYEQSCKEEVRSARDPVQVHGRVRPDLRDVWDSLVGGGRRGGG